MSTNSVINGNKPIFFIHQSPQQRKRLPELMEYLTKSFGDSMEFGIIARMSKYQPDYIESFLSQFECPIKIADPEVYNHRDNFNKKHNDSYIYLKDEIPIGRDLKWVEKILSYQYQVGATALLSPSVLLNTINARKELDQQIQWIKDAQELSDRDIIANFTLKHSWITDEQLRSMLLNELIDLDISNIYLRVLWPSLIPRYGQLASEDILKGYKIIIDALSVEGKVLILPTSGLTGWISVALGATGFSMGPSREQQAFVIEPIIRRAKGSSSAPRRSRYFESKLLHIVDLETHDSLLNTKNYSACNCRYCKEMGANDVNRKSWNHELATLHYLNSTAYLTSLLNNRNKRAIAHRLVQEAMDFLSTLPTTLKPQGENIPRHLTLWNDLLS